MTSENENGEAADRRPPPRPVVNDRPPEDDSEARAEALRQDTGGAIDVDAAHDRSS
jgi:hypothetical protein